MSTTTPISFNGLASGINTSAVISQLVQSEQAPITQIQSQESIYNQELTDWQTVNTDLANLQSAATTLTEAPTFTASTATSSNTAVASITTVPGAQIGTHSLTVSQLAQSQKVVSNAVASSSAALGESGSFTLNGQTINVTSSESLSDLSTAINAAGAGVTSSIVNVSAGNYRLIITGNQTGAVNAISASDNGSATILSDLGVLSGTAAIRDAVTPSTGETGAGSLALTSATQTVANTLGDTSGSAASGTVQINGVSVAINLNTDSLNTIAANINNAGISGVTAEVVSLPDSSGNISGSSPQQLQILSSSGSAPTFTDSSNVLSTLGVVQQSFTNTLSTAQDASFNLDGLAMTRPTNSLSDVIQGATVNLLSAGTTASPVSTTLSITQNTSAIVQSVQTFVTAYNAVQDFISQENTFTPPAGSAASGTQGTSPSLFGNTTLQSIQQQLNNTLNAVSGSMTLANVGLSLNSTGDLSLDTTTLSNALQTNATQVSNLFGLSGLTDNSNVQSIAATSSTVASTGQGYPINITQAASQSTVVAGTAQTAASTAPETLTFSGSLFNGGTASITLAQGNTLQDTVNQINASSSLNNYVYASIDTATNSLKLSSLTYGSHTAFSVASSVTSGGSGIGSGATDTAGTDVEGTINNEPATGNGRTLTANSGNSTTQGIQLLVSASAPGSYGYVQITHGVADALSNTIASITDPTTGGIALAENSINSQISSAQSQITQIQQQVTAYQQYLTQMFSEMETQINELQSQASAFAAETGSSSTSSSSSTGTSLGSGLNTGSSSSSATSSSTAA
jgi:flagellar hook-associated protein 2